MSVPAKGSGDGPGDNMTQPTSPAGHGLVERILQVDEAIASTHRVRWSLLIKVGVPAVLILFVLIAGPFTSSLTTVESLITAALVTLIGVPGIALLVLLRRGRSDRRRLRAELDALLFDPPEGSGGDSP